MAVAAGLVVEAPEVKMGGGWVAGLAEAGVEMEVVVVEAAVVEGCGVTAAVQSAGSAVGSAAATVEHSAAGSGIEMVAQAAVERSAAG
jgi:hypothetical protein